MGLTQGCPAPRGPQAMSEDILFVTLWVFLASTGWRSGMLLNTSQCPGWPPKSAQTQMSYLGLGCRSDLVPSQNPVLSQIPLSCLSYLNFKIPGNEKHSSPAGARLELPRHCWGILLNLHFMRLWRCENNSQKIINGLTFP